MFSAPTKDKTTLFTMFSFSRNPKIEPKHRYLRCFCNTKKSQRSQNTAFARLLQHHICKMLYFTVFLNHLFKNTGSYGVLKNYLHKTLEVPTNSNFCIFLCNKLTNAKTLIFTAFLNNDCCKKLLFLERFSPNFMRWVPSKFEQIPKTSFFANNLHLFRGSATWAEPPYG